MLKKYLKFIFFSLFLIIIFSSLLVQAQSSQASTRDDLNNQLKNTAKAGWGAEPIGQNSLAGIIQIAISTFLSLLGIIFIVLIVYAGYNWMMAGGDEDKVNLAKQTLSRAVIGLIIIVAAYSITYFVFINLPGGGGNSAFGG